MAATGLLAIVAALLAGEGTAAAKVWQRAVNVSAPVAQPDAPRVAMNPAGDTVVVWVDDEGGVQAVVRRAGGAFSAPARLARGVQDTVVNYPTIAIDGAGNAIAAWQRDNDLSVGSSIQAVVIPASGPPQPPVTLSRRNPYGAAVAMNAAGHAIVTWTAKASSGEVVQASTRPPGGSFSPAVNLSAGGEHASFSDVAMNAAGDTIVAWPRGPLEAQAMQAVVRPAGGGFSAPVNLSAAGEDASAPSVAIDAAGDAAVVWNTVTGSPIVVRAALRSARGAFAPPIILSPLSRDGLVSSVKYDAAGTATVIWLHEDFARLDANGGVQMSTRAPNGSFTPPVYLSNAAYGAEFPSLAVNASGAAIVAWDRATEDIVNSTGVQAVLRGPGGSFSPPVTLSRAREKVGYPPQIAIDGSGNAIVVWLSGRDGGSLQARVYADAPLPVRPVAPRVTGLRVSPAGFRPARSGSATKTSDARRGARVSYALSIAASLRFGVQRASPGRRVGGRCVAARAANRSRPRCTRFARVAGSFGRERPAGTDRFAFTGRLAGRPLARGRYRLVVVPTAAGLRGASSRARFRILR